MPKAWSTPMMQLELKLPEDVYIGEYVVAEMTLTNTGGEPREVSKHLNLAKGTCGCCTPFPGDRSSRCSTLSWPAARARRRCCSPGSR